MSEPSVIEIVEPMPKRDMSIDRSDTNETGLLAVIERAARDPNIDIAKMEKLLEMSERIEARRAESAFIAAISEFKANPPRIVKDSRVDYTSQKTGQRTQYDHASLANVVRTVTEGLGRVGISHRWETDQADGGRIRVTCVLTHVGGFSTRTTLSASPDDSGGKNNIQAIGSSVTYLQRYTLMAATGLAAGVADDDGAATSVEYVTESQAADLRAKAEEVGANEKSFLAYMEAESFATIKASDFQKAVAALEAKARKGKA